jgi:hypothetical protein
MLFTRNDDIYKNAFPNWQKTFKQHDEYFALYAEHFKEAADKLILSIKENYVHIADSIVNPALYLYRHSIELCLKAILYHNYFTKGLNIEKIKENKN